MGATSVKPIQPTVIQFKNESEYENFVGYAKSNEKTRSPQLDRLRALVQKRLQERE